MKQFAIAINSEKEYNEVKKYAEKWGYKFKYPAQEIKGFNPFSMHNVIFIENGMYEPQVINYKDSVFEHNWRKAIRKNSPLKLENICVRIDTVERVKEVWDIIKDCGIAVLESTNNRLKSSSISEVFKYVHYNTYYGNVCGIQQYQVDEQNKTEITPRQLAQILGVKRKQTEPVWNTFQLMVIDNLGESIKDLNRRIDKLAKNYKITESDTLATKKELKAVNDKLCKRLYELENSTIEPVLTISADKLALDLKPVSKIIHGDNEANVERIETVLPKIAIRVENEQEFNDLMKIYDVLGWVNFGHDRGYVSREFVVACYVEFKNNFSCFNITDDYIKPKGSLFIPFSQIKGLK